MTPDNASSGGLLDGQVALVVGAASGIGRAVTERFVAEGASVVALDLSAEGLGRLEGAGAGHLDVLQGDATEPQATTTAVEQARSRHGRLDLLVCCAGRFDFRAPVSTLDPHQLARAFDEIFAVNVKSTLFAVQAAAAELTRRRGAVVLTSSSSAFYPEGAGVLYGASKWAVRGLVAHLARELAPAVRVNGVAPGGTGRTRLGGLASLGQTHTVEEVAGRDQRIARGNLLGSLATPEDHAGTYLFLASPRLSGLVTGVVINSDGGRGEALGDASSEPGVDDEGRPAAPTGGDRA